MESNAALVKDLTRNNAKESSLARVEYLTRITLTELWSAPKIGLKSIGKFNIIVRLASNQDWSR